MSVITKKIKEVTCKRCKGKGCNLCNNAGIYKEYYSYFIDDDKKIAFGGENGQ